MCTLPETDLAHRDFPYFRQKQKSPRPGGHLGCAQSIHFPWELNIVQRRAGALDGGDPYNLVQGPPGSILVKYQSRPA